MYPPAERSPTSDPWAAPIHAPSDALSRRFRIDRVIGTGGMGVVVAAHHLGLDKLVAIKLMRPELRARREFVRRFVREARAAARMNSRHVARVFDVGVLGDGAPYIVMEYLDGVDLASWLRRRGAVPVPLAATIIRQVGDAIAEAHAVGIVHRDLKPANLLVTAESDGEPLVKVLDLGICKLLSPADEPGDTSTGPALGTPAYMAPEQLASARRVDGRADIWSLGVILYELVTGRVPFQGHTVGELPACVTGEPGLPIDGAGVPRGLEAIIARCLANDPAARFQRVADLAAALKPFAADAGRRGAVSPAGSSGRVARRARRLWAMPAAVVVALAASWAWLAAQPETGHSAEEASREAAPASALRPVGPRCLLDAAGPAAAGKVDGTSTEALPAGALPSHGAPSPPTMPVSGRAVPRSFAPLRPPAPQEVKPRLRREEPRPLTAHSQGDIGSVRPISSQRDVESGPGSQPVSQVVAPSARSVVPVDPLATPY